ncbi:Arabinosidase A [Aspergillus violaceofuscus CBS 115571]|uniref:non-reducing end alpha-L-arabinofuranosidase n=1 Tax=Aspergillus violaceofuscus (strain CBS 115571) TaxID=1450538 RepID=A0A2V5I7V3_ASPV1|nr:Arabinosidase A [Aspergillus violaceofuscus CBS 115571]
MVVFSGLRGIAALSLFFSLVQQACSLSLVVNKAGGNASSPLLYGFMFEDINHSGDGGIHGQMLQNPGPQGSSPSTTAWTAVGKGTIAVDSENPLSSAITHSFRLDVASGATGAVGFINDGYWGIPVDGNEFESSFWIKGDYSGKFTVRLLGNSTGTVYGSKTFTHKSNSKTFTQASVKFPSKRAPDSHVVYELTVDGKAAAGSSLYFGYITLYGKMYKSRENGLRPQIANYLADVKGSFLRFPGGNNLEGNSVDNRWKWNETIGPLEDRPGREGTWDYWNTDALGLAEYFYWCEDLGLTPVLGVWAGFALDSGGGTPLTGDALTPYVDDVLNELEYILGDKSTTYGALRVSHGQKEPWSLTMVEIGNEDNLGGGCASYPERFTAFYDAIHAKYPDLTLISSTADSSCLPDEIPEGTWVDYHNYNTPDNLVAQFGQFDNINRTVGYFIGEYSRWEITWPNMKSSVAEAVYMIGFERNSDLVKMAAYAPLLQLVNSTQWTPDLIPFTQDPEMAWGSTSYYVQKLFSENRGSTIKEVTSDSGFGPVYWVASNSGDTYYVKLANYGEKSESVSVTVPGAKAGTLSLVSDSDPDAANTDLEQNLVVPYENQVKSSNGTFTFTMPAWGVGVLAVH